MIFLTQKKRNKILKQLANCQMLCSKHIKDDTLHAELTELLADTIYDIGGVEAVIHTSNMLDKVLFEKEEKIKESKVPPRYICFGKCYDENGSLSCPMMDSSATCRHYIECLKACEYF